MEIVSHDSDTLKPPELDELGQVLAASGADIPDEEIDRQVESFPLVVRSRPDGDEVDGFLFASLERIGGTPCVLWGLGATTPGRQARKTLTAMTDELYRRAAITFPDEDVLVGGRFSQPCGYALLDPLSDTVPRPGHKASGEERAWGRRLAKRFGCEDRYDDRAFEVTPNGAREPAVDMPPLSGAAPKVAKQVFDAAEVDGAGAIVAFGWAIAEDLAGRLR